MKAEIIPLVLGNLTHISKSTWKDLRNLNCTYILTYTMTKPVISHSIVHSYFDHKAIISLQHPSPTTTTYKRVFSLCCWNTHGGTFPAKERAYKLDQINLFLLRFWSQRFAQAQKETQLFQLQRPSETVDHFFLSTFPVPCLFLNHIRQRSLHWAS